MLSFILLSITLIALMVSFWKDRERTRKALLISYRSFMALVPSLLGMTGLVGLVLALIPPNLLTNLFKFHGIAGFVLIALVGAIVTMPAPVAFPLAGSLFKLGASLPALAAFITTLTMVGIVTAPMEVAYFGKRFTVVRQSLSFILAILIGVLMGVFL
ncbi:MAG: permease [Geobacteraceae bacterium]|jgi:uncharacterized membrane protein YraQ (UPF0718 family)